MNNPLIGDPRLPARFWSKVALGSPPEFRPSLGPCWVWNRPPSPDGYGQFWTGGGRAAGKNARAHRHAYLALLGPTPLWLDHLCRVRHCVNPAHLEPVTPRENHHRSPLTNASKTHCLQGHEFSAANTRINSEGRRKCRACARDDWQAIKAARAMGAAA